VFIVLAGALALITALALALPVLRGRTRAPSRAAYDAQTYRAQLTEVDQDRARGVLTEAEAKAAKVEISRRLISATDEMEGEAAAREASPATRKAIGFGAAIGVPLFAALLYLSIGEPGRPDMPLASRTDFESMMAQRPSQSEAETIMERAGYAPVEAPADDPEAKRVAEMVAEVEAVLVDRPDDARGRLLLARTQSQLGRYDDAWRNYAILIDKAAQPDVEMYGDMVQAMVSATNSYVSPQTETVVDRGLTLAPSDPRFQHYKALALAQRGEDTEALARWTVMLENAEPGAPWAAMVYGHAAEVARGLGVEPPATPVAAPAPRDPDSPPGPTREQIEAVTALPQADQTAMIEGMVAGLAERLADDPDDLQGWLRLIRAYAVLGRAEQRNEAVAMARATFTGDTRALEQIEAAAR